MPRGRRSAAKRKVNHGLRDEDKVEEPRQEKNEQITQQPIENQVMPRDRRSALKRKVNHGLRDEDKVEKHRQEQNEQVTQQPIENQVMPRDQRSAAKRIVNHGLRDEDEVEEPRQEQNEQITQQPIENQVMPRDRRSAAKRKVNHELRDGNEVEVPRQKQNEQVTQQPIENQVMPRTRRSAAKRKVNHGLRDEDEVEEHEHEQNELVTQQRTWKQVMPRDRRSAAKKKVNHGLRDKDEVEEPGQEQNEQFTQQPTWKQVIPRDRRSSAKKKANHGLRDEGEVGEPRHEQNEQVTQQPTLKQVMPRVRRSGAKGKVNHELQDEDEVEEPGQEQNEHVTQQPTWKQVMPRVRRSGARRKVNHELQDEDAVEEHEQEQNELATQQPYWKQVMTRSRRSGAKRKVNHELRDEDEVEEHVQMQNEQFAQQPTEKQVMAPSSQRATANQNEQSRQQPQPQISQQQIRQQPQPQISQQQSRQQPQSQISQQASREQAKRGPTYLRDVWARTPNEERILVSFNIRGQPIGPNKKKFTGFLGTLARNGEFVPLDIEDWRKVPKARKDEMIDIVKERFEVPQGAEHWILLSIAKKRRHWKSRVKTGYFKTTLPVQNQIFNRPIRVNEDQWNNLLPHWTKEDVQEVSEKNKDHRELSIMRQTTGKLSFAEVEEELKEQLGRTPTRMELFGACYCDSSGDPPNVEVQDALAQMREHQSKLTPGSQDKVGPTDSFAKVRGKDPHGRVRMLGLGVNPSDMWGHIPSHNTCYRMVLENQEALVRMEEKMDRAIADFQQKLQPQQNPNNISLPRPLTSPVQSSNAVNPGRRLQVGALVLLKSVFDPSKIVAKGFVRSVDPNQEVGGKRLGSNWYKVQISCPIDSDEDLIRPYLDFSTIGDAFGTCVAWPHNLVILADDEE